jgi:Fe2+ or Zn2+ uptake regulation protein
MVTSQVKTFFWRVMSVLTTLLVIGMAFLLFGCSSLYERAKLRYATAKVDTVYKTIQTVVPADSVGFTLPTDTTVVYKEIHHDRARILFRRDKNQTSVQAFCDTLVITKKVATQITTQHWGVDPTYKQQAETRLSIIYGLSAFIALGVIVFVLSRRYQFTVTKRSNGTGAATEPN